MVSMNAPTHDALLKPGSFMASVVLVVAVAIALLGVMAGTSGAASGDTIRVSVSSTGAQANGTSPSFYGSQSTSISADGRFVAFDSEATNLVPNDTNGEADIFVHDRQTGTTKQVVYGTDPSLSADGRFLAYTRPGGVIGDRGNIFVRDLQSGGTRRVDVSSSGAQPNRYSGHPSISADGRFVAFDSRITNLVAGDTNGDIDVFVRNLRTGTTRRVSVSSSGAQANKLNSTYPSISAHGRFVSFTSSATNLVAGDTNGRPDVFVRNLRTGTTRRVSVSSSGAQANSVRG
jgi:Tol biopolymer transport system component